MSRITIIAGGTVRDLDAFRAISEEAAAIVESDLPGTLVYEYFVNEKSSHFIANEAYVGGPSIRKHAERLMAAGIVARMADQVDFDLNVALGDVDGDTSDLPSSFGFQIYEPLAKSSE